MRYDQINKHEDIEANTVQTFVLNPIGTTFCILSKPDSPFAICRFLFTTLLCIPDCMKVSVLPYVFAGCFFDDV